MVVVGLQGLHRYGLEGDSGPSTPHSVTTRGGGGGGEHVIRLAPNPCRNCKFAEMQCNAVFAFCSFALPAAGFRQPGGQKKGDGGGGGLSPECTCSGGRNSFRGCIPTEFSEEGGGVQSLNEGELSEGAGGIFG